jgi:hypothetical protein
MSSCEQYFVLGTWPYAEQTHAMPKLRLFTRDGVCCSTLTIGRRLWDVHYMLVTAGAVHVGHGTKIPEQSEGILRVPLEVGLSNAERKSLRGLQDLDLELTSFEEEREEGSYYSDEEEEEEGYDSDEGDDEP